MAACIFRNPTFKIFLQKGPSSQVFQWACYLPVSICAGILTGSLSQMEHMPLGLSATPDPPAGTPQCASTQPSSYQGLLPSLLTHRLVGIEEICPESIWDPKSGIPGELSQALWPPSCWVVNKEAALRQSAAHSQSTCYCTSVLYHAISDLCLRKIANCWRP